jgi:hypothetical protein
MASQIFQSIFEFDGIRITTKESPQGALYNFRTLQVIY